MENAIRVLHATSGSTNAVLHMLALIEELELDPPVTLDTFEALSRETPFIADIQPSGRHPMETFHEAGGIPAVMKQIASQLDLEVATVGHDSLRRAAGGLLASETRRSSAPWTIPCSRTASSSSAAASLAPP